MVPPEGRDRDHSLRNHSISHPSRGHERGKGRQRARPPVPKVHRENPRREVARGRHHREGAHRDVLVAKTSPIQGVEAAHFSSLDVLWARFASSLTPITPMGGSPDPAVVPATGMFDGMSNIVFFP